MTFNVRGQGQLQHKNEKELENHTKLTQYNYLGTYTGNQIQRFCPPLYKMVPYGNLDKF